MYGLVSGLLRIAWKRFCSPEEFNVLLVGPGGVGKTHILEKAKELYAPQQNISPKDAIPLPMFRPSLIVPTRGLNTSKIVADRARITFWDLGGDPSLRSIWASYFPTAHAVIYVFDGSSEANFAEAKAALHGLLRTVPGQSEPSTESFSTGSPSPTPGNNPIPILLLANKRDLRPFASAAQFMELFELPSSLPIHIEFAGGTDDLLSLPPPESGGPRLKSHIPKRLRKIAKGSGGGKPAVAAVADKKKFDSPAAPRTLPRAFLPPPPPPSAPGTHLPPPSPSTAPANTVKRGAECHPLHPIPLSSPRGPAASTTPVLLFPMPPTLDPAAEGETAPLLLGIDPDRLPPAAPDVELPQPLAVSPPPPPPPPLVMPPPGGAAHARAAAAAAPSGDVDLLAAVRAGTLMGGAEEPEQELEEEEQEEQELGSQPHTRGTGN
ncbi:putative ADP-ribosylation factor-related protein 1 [Paratrimastix pyriformis]|uniref:ADP-ribosylation factor-related protein 1 n=1 Tax=Paratrimastix pyriformis TaxID=342808 RepID=A0ABQ8UW22_9EUKA|nr:putative ADP-ribosylation factor-related protein 1 [Paratrimastix pyriformis]